MRYAAWVLLGMLAITGCSSPTVRYYEENPNAAATVRSDSGSHERKLAFVRKLAREKHGLELTDPQAEQLVYLYDMRASGKMTEAQARAALGADEPMPTPMLGGPSPFRFYTFPNGKQMTCHELGMSTNCY